MANDAKSTRAALYIGEDADLDIAKDANLAKCRTMIQEPIAILLTRVGTTSVIVLAEDPECTG